MQKLKLKSGQQEFELEINDWAARAGISIAVKSGGSLVLTTIVVGDEKKLADFVPLTVDYEEKFYAAGKIYGSRFVRREGRPSETAVLHARLIDRSIRPALVNQTRELQLVNSVFSYDGQNDPTVMAFLGSSLAIEMLGFDWLGPVTCVRIKKSNGHLELNPVKSRTAGDALEDNDDFNLLVAGTAAKINMIEFEGAQVPATDIVKACQIAQAEIQKLAEALADFAKKLKMPELKNQRPEANLGLAETFLKEEKIDLEELLFGQSELIEPVSTVFQRLQERQAELAENFAAVRQGLTAKIKLVFKKKVLTDKVRPDGRPLDEVRPLKAEVDVLPRTHGSALFARGLTHILSTVTLATPGEELWVKEIEFEGFKRFIHHYNFPPYSVGELGRLGPPGRREIGHGALAEKALRRIIPSEETFPYTIRLVSDALTSNGSTSMGSVCAGCLALQDAGVPIQKAVSGISIGLVYDNEKNYQLLTDIQGPEDHYGEMDFKVAETETGIVAIQMDVKTDGLSVKMIEEALQAASRANKKIRAFMSAVIAAPRQAFKSGVPYIETLQIDPTKIGIVIGGGGKTIQEITASTNTKIDIKPNGLVYIASENKTDIDRAKKWITGIVHEFQLSEQVSGKVIKFLPYGALIELSPEKTALLHVSEIAQHRVERAEDELKLNQILPLVVKQINPDGKISVSLKDARRNDAAGI